MSVVRRQLPESNFTRSEALERAILKLGSIPPASNPLTAATTTRLQNTASDFAAKLNELSLAKSAYNANTLLKNAARKICLINTNHFIQVFNLAVARGVFLPSDRAFYQLPVESDQLPDMGTESELLIWSGRVVQGEANRVAGGGIPLGFPDSAQVSIARTAFQDAFATQSTLKDALDLKQEALEAILEKTDRTIKKVWDELETFYNEETPESQRANCREWGVVYVNVGSSKKMQGAITLEGAPAAGYVVRFATGRNKATSDAQGNYTLNTTLAGEQKVYVLRIDENGIEIKSWDFEVTLPGNGDLPANFNLIESEGKAV